MFNKIIGILTNARNLPLVGLAVVLLLASSFGSGYLVGGRDEARVQTKEITKTIYIPVKEIQQVQVRNIERERVLEERLGEAGRLAANQRTRLNALAVDNRVLGADIVRLLNENISASNPPTDPPGVPAGETTTVTDLTNWAFDASNQYREVSTRYDALIDWVEEELIEPSRPLN